MLQYIWAYSLFFFFPVQENYINLLRSNSGGNPSVSSVIAGLWRQKRPFCLNSWISSAPLLSSLCPTVPVTHIQDVRRVSSPLRGNWEVDASFAWQLESHRQEREWHSLLGLPPDFGKRRWVALFSSQATFTEELQLSQFFTRMWSGSDVPLSVWTGWKCITFSQFACEPFGWKW